MPQVNLLIDGVPYRASNQACFDCRNPVSGEVVSRAAAATVQDAGMAVEAAARAFGSWKLSRPAERRRLLLKAADVLESMNDDFQRAMRREVGGTREWIAFNVELGARHLREAASLATQIGGQVIPTDSDALLSMALRQPAGVVLGIAPWNAPIILGVRAMAAPLACGNTVIFKGSEHCPHTHALIVECLLRAGLPKGVVNYITHAPQDAAQVVEALIAAPAVRRVNFTGSTQVGRLIGIKCAEHFKPALLELGGKAPMLVMRDADLDLAADAAVVGCFANAGQICMSTERLVVDDSIADAFIERLLLKAKGIRCADPLLDADADMGPVISMKTVRHCNELIDDALSKGAKLLCGGKSDSTLMRITLLDHVTPRMRIYREESFGPVKGITRFQGAEQALAHANDNEFGLSAAVFSRDVAFALRMAKQIESGICHINGTTVNDEPQMPFGGLKASGIGKFGNMYGVAEFTDVRWVTVGPARGDDGA